MRTCELQVEDLVADDIRTAAQKVYCTHAGDLPVFTEAVSKIRHLFKVTTFLEDGRWRRRRNRAATKQRQVGRGVRKRTGTQPQVSPYHVIRA